MYGIKRNVIKRTGTNRVDGNVTKRVVKSTGYGKYRYPICGEVPPGNYYSEVMTIRDTQTKAGKPAIDVFYKIKSADVCHRLANNKPVLEKANQFYYVKQTCPEEKTCYYDFIDSMAEALEVPEDEDFDLADAIGVTEYLTLEYDKGEIGSIKDRMPFKYEYFVDLEEDEYEEPEVEPGYELDIEF